MQLQLSDEQIAQARALRAEGKSYADIKALIGAEVEADSLRHHCADVAINGTIRTRRDTGPRQGKDGRTITPFSSVEDDAIVQWVTIPLVQERVGSMAALAKQLGRKRHSVAARIKTLRKHGRLPAP